MKPNVRRLLVVAAGTAALLCSAAEPQDKADFKLSKAEQTILDLTNQAREKEKLPPLKPNPVLFEVARAHAANMAKQAKMEHVLNGRNPAQRVTAAGYRYSVVGENVAWSNELRPEEIFKGWMESEHHKDNILQAKFKEIGIGIARNDKGDIYYAQVFGTRRQKR